MKNGLNWLLTKALKRNWQKLKKRSAMEKSESPSRTPLLASAPPKRNSSFHSGSRVPEIDLVTTRSLDAQSGSPLPLRRAQP